MNDVSGFGLSATIVAVQSFPMGFTVTKFADDADPLMVDDNEPGGFEMLYDGSLFSYTKASPTMVAISVIPNSEDDINLKILLAARQVTNHILPISDVTSMVLSYPDGGRVVLSNGTILKGPPADSVTQAGRRKGNTYTFAFGTTGGAQSTRQITSEIIQAGLGLL